MDRFTDQSNGDHQAEVRHAAVHHYLHRPHHDAGRPPILIPVTIQNDGLCDLGSRSDVHDLVVGFYREVVFDDVLEPVFGEVAEVDWATHIPKLIDYWCRVLFGDPSYQGTVLAPHRHVHEIDPLRGEHFDRWYRLWVTAIDEGWTGPTAEQAKSHAARIGGSLARRLIGTDWAPEVRPPNSEARLTPSTGSHSALIPS